MHPTGIEPVTTPWKGDILPLNYECVKEGRTLCASEKRKEPLKRSTYAAQPVPDEPDDAGITAPFEETQLSPLVIPSQVNPACNAFVHNSFARFAGSDEEVFNEK